MSTKRINITMPDILHERASIAAKTRGYTFSGFIKNAINKELEGSLLRINDKTYKEALSVSKKYDVKLEDFVREALEDAIAPEKVTISVSEETKKMYHKMFAFDEVSDQGFERYLKEAMANYLEDKIIKKLKS